MRVSSSDDYPDPLWKDIVFGFRPLTKEDLIKLGKPSLRYTLIRVRILKVAYYNPAAQII
jgi:hypothetical protein